MQDRRSNKGLGQSQRAGSEQVLGEQRPSGERRRRHRTNEKRSDDATDHKEAAWSPTLSEMRDARLQTGGKSFRMRRGSHRHRHTRSGVEDEHANLGQTDQQGGGEPRASVKMSWMSRIAVSWRRRAAGGSGDRLPRGGEMRRAGRGAERPT